MATLDSVEIEGYKSIRSAKIDLGPINVLIGANGAGKSNLLGVFGLLADLADGRLQLHIGRQGGADAVLHFGSKQTSRLSLRARLGAYTYDLALMLAASDRLVFERETPMMSSGDPSGVRDEQLSSSGKEESGLPRYGPVVEAPISSAIATELRQWRPFHFHDTSRSAPTKKKHKIDDNHTLRPEGDNIAPFLLGLRTRAPGAYYRIVESVRSIAPFFDDFVLRPDLIRPDLIQLAWRHRSDDMLFTADALSDGTLRFICLATLLSQPELPSLIVIDEPELGLHPFAIAQLVSMIRVASSKSQILLATQSVTLLDQFDANEVIVVENDDAESSFRRLNDVDLDGWRQQYSLGDLWLKNVLGGRPQ